MLALVAPHHTEQRGVRVSIPAVYGDGRHHRDVAKDCTSLITVALSRNALCQMAMILIGIPVIGNELRFLIWEFSRTFCL